MLETSEGLQVAKQLTAARERTRETQGQAQEQQKSLEAARQAKRASIERLERQMARFNTMKAESVAQLRELGTLAREESYWEVAAFQ